MFSVRHASVSVSDTDTTPVLCSIFWTLQVSTCLCRVRCPYRCRCFIAYESFMVFSFFFSPCFFSLGHLYVILSDYRNIVLAISIHLYRNTIIAVPTIVNPSMAFLIDSRSNSLFSSFSFYKLKIISK